LGRRRFRSGTFQLFSGLGWAYPKLREIWPKRNRSLSRFMI
jgi:hypothetical protein